MPTVSVDPWDKSRHFCKAFSTFFILLSVSGEWTWWWEGKICKNVTYLRPQPLVFWLRHFFTPVVTLLSTLCMSSLDHINISSQSSLLVCMCVCVFLLKGQCRGPGGWSKGYVWERGSKVLAGLSWLLMTAIDRTSHTPSPCALHTTSSSTTLTPTAAALPHPTSPPTQDSSNASWGPRQRFGLTVSLKLLIKFVTSL